MSLIWHLIVSLAVTFACAIVVRGSALTRETTLRSASNWSLGAALAWGLTWFTDSCGHFLSPVAGDHAWYASAVLAVCPPIAVLGSRRPGTRVWSWFILIPMILALCWPILALRLQGSEFHRLHLETPQLVAFILVLVMGVGNYCGTRYTLSALMYGVATLAIVISCSRIAENWFADRAWLRSSATAGMAIAIFLTKTSPRPVGPSRFDTLWFDFFDSFGIVWGRRIQDRVNFIAIKEHWPCRLELDGFVTLDARHEVTRSKNDLTAPPSNLNPDEPAIESDLSKLDRRREQTFRWLLRRFVDPAWIDRRLESNDSVVLIEDSVDS